MIRSQEGAQTIPTGAPAQFPPVAGALYEGPRGASKARKWCTRLLCGLSSPFSMRPPLPQFRCKTAHAPEAPCVPCVPRLRLPCRSRPRQLPASTGLSPAWPSDTGFFSADCPGGPAKLLCPRGPPFSLLSGTPGCGWATACVPSTCLLWTLRLHPAFGCHTPRALNSRARVLLCKEVCGL